MKSRNRNKSTSLAPTPENARILLAGFQQACKAETDPLKRAWFYSEMHRCYQILGETA